MKANGKVVNENKIWNKIGNLRMTCILNQVEKWESELIKRRLADLTKRVASMCCSVFHFNFLFNYHLQHSIIFLFLIILILKKKCQNNF